MHTAGKIISTLMFLLIFSHGSIGFAAPKAELWARWQKNVATSTLHVDHSIWGQFLMSYVVVNKMGNPTLVRYAAVTPEDRASLDEYVASLAAVPVSQLNRDEQKAFWINLYNSLTVKTILDHFPVKSIRDISSGWFRSGPWDLKLITVEGVEVSLNDIEHRILRPIWQDNRVHYAVNCASLGCPNLQPEPFTAENLESLLESAAHDYVNSPRGVDFVAGELTLSSIYDWFQVDFGGSETSVVSHLKQYAEPTLRGKLTGYWRDFSYRYSWSLNKQ